MLGKVLAHGCACNNINKSPEGISVLEKNIIKSNLPVEYEIYQKITKVNIRFGDIFGVGKSEIKDFQNF